MKQRGVFVYGDSHSVIFYHLFGKEFLHNDTMIHVNCEWSGCSPASYLPLSMYMMGEKGLDIIQAPTRIFQKNKECDSRGILRKNIIPQNGDIVIYTFGYNDVQKRIFEQVDKGRSLEEILENLVDKYIASIVKNAKTYPNLHHIVYAIMPPPCGPGKVDYRGSIEDRVKLTKRLNDMLREKCTIFWSDLVDRVTRSDGILDSKFTNDNIHISQDHIDIVRDELIKLLDKLPPSV